MQYASPSPEEEILAQVRSDFDCWAEGDTEGYARSAGDDVTYFHHLPARRRVDGIQAFGAFMASLKGQIPAHRYEIEDPKLQVHRDIGVYSFVYHALSLEGESFGRVRGTCVYKRVDNAWKTVHSHWSVLEEA